MCIAYYYLHNFYGILFCIQWTWPFDSIAMVLLGTVSVNIFKLILKKKRKVKVSINV